MSKLVRIAADLIEDGTGRILLVRKAGTHAFMQAGGKIEPGETPVAALIRELDEEGEIVPEEYEDIPPNLYAQVIDKVMIDKSYEWIEEV